MNFSRVLNPNQPKPQPMIARTPQATPSTRAHVETPLASTIVTVIIVMGVPAVLVGLWPVPPKWIVLSVITWLVMNAAWFWQSNLFRETMWKIEEATGAELTGDTIRGKPYASVMHGKGGAPRPLTPEQILNKRFSDFLDTVYRIESAAYARLVKEGWENKDEIKRFRDAAIQAGIFMQHPDGRVEALVTRERAKQIEANVRWNVREGVY